MSQINALPINGFTIADLALLAPGPGQFLEVGGATEGRIDIDALAAYARVGTATASQGTLAEAALQPSDAGATGLALLATETPEAALSAIGAASRNSILAAYNFGIWQPANLSFAETPAPSTGTQIDNDYVSFSNSGGLLTITLDVAGSYFFSVLTTSNHGASFSAARIRFDLGGTATLGTPAGGYNNNGQPIWDMASTTSFSAAGTGGQTVTIRPFYEVTGSGSVAQHAARCVVTILYCGS